MLDPEYIKKCALEEGFSLCGVARAQALTQHTARLEEWLSAGNGSQLGYMSRNIEKRIDPTLLVPGTQTVVVCAVNYKNAAWNRSDDTNNDTPKIASYAYMRDYHTTVKDMLMAVLLRLQKKYPGMSGRAFTDSAPVLEKAWAVEAGLGWIGRNTLVVTPQYGSFVILGELVLDMPSTGYDTPFLGERCGNCRRCTDTCPTGAICESRTIDTRRCISRLTIERAPASEGHDNTESTLPEWWRQDKQSLNGWIFGCDECQSCCPYNGATSLASDMRFAPVIDVNMATEDFWRTMSGEQFNNIFGDTPLARAGFEAIKNRL